MAKARKPKKSKGKAAPAPADVETAADSTAEQDQNGESTATLARGSTEDSLLELMSVNYLEYASYVIKDRAIPDVADGLKPVQRRILHSLHVMDDGRLHKVANVIGHTMQYHPHGDASIGSALVVLANKEYYIDKQGNFGNIFTGDEASAARYIECRLTPLAREVLFNDEITQFADSYDGRNREPVRLPAKVPSLLMLGSDGIAVGMTTRILPHNFRELLKAQIKILNGRAATVYPDFLTGGVMDVSAYDDGRGRVKVRAKIEEVNDKTLVIRELPPTTTTESLIGSMEEAARRGKIKLAAINDFTGEQVEIQITLPRGIYAEETLRQLYAYTDCEVAISSNIMVIRETRPMQMTVSEVLAYNTENLVAFLEQELKLKLGKLEERFHERTLAQIFIENRVYKRIEQCKTFETVLAAVHDGLKPFLGELRREVTDEDVQKLLQIQIRRISLFDINRNREELEEIARSMEQTRHDLGHLTPYAIQYLEGLLERYGKSYPRRTKVADLETVDVREVALKNVKVGHDRQAYFVGSDVRNSNKNEDPLLCTEYDRIVLLRNDGKFKVLPVPDKLYVGPVKYLLLSDREQVYSMLYRDRKRGTYYAKRFRIDRYIMDREYRTIPPGCIIENLYTNYGVVVRCEFKPNKRLAHQYVDVDFDEIPIRSTGARGFKVAAHPVASFVQLRRGNATPAGEDDGENDDTDSAAERDTGSPAAADAAPLRTETETGTAERPVPEAVDPNEPADVPAALPSLGKAGPGREQPASDSPEAGRQETETAELKPGATAAATPTRQRRQKTPVETPSASPSSRGRKTRKTTARQSAKKKESTGKKSADSPGKRAAKPGKTMKKKAADATTETATRAPAPGKAETSRRARSSDRAAPRDPERKDTPVTREPPSRTIRRVIDDETPFFLE